MADAIEAAATAAGPPGRAAPGFRRRIRIEPGPETVTASFEDDWHRMSVTLAHRDGVVHAARGEMLRWPWTACPGAIERFEQTFTGVRMAEAARRGEKTANCTHLYDLALLACAHAGDDGPLEYQVAVSDPVDGARAARLSRDGAVVLDWRLEGDRLVGPPALAGLALGALNPWIAGLDAAGREAARLLRWTAMMAVGRQMSIADDVPADTFPLGACFNFQPGRAEGSRRRPGAHRDFSVSGRTPLAPVGDAQGGPR